MDEIKVERPRLRRNWISNKRLAALMDAYETLYGTRPIVVLHGTWRTDRKELILFGQEDSLPVFKIEANWLTVWVDGVPLHLSGTMQCSFTLFAE